MRRSGSITSERAIEALTGFAGAGKSAAIAAARDAWQAEGYRVLGGALSGIAAENLQRESGHREPDAGVMGEGVAGGPGTA